MYSGYVKCVTELTEFPLTEVPGRVLEVLQNLQKYRVYV